MKMDFKTKTQEKEQIYSSIKNFLQLLIYISVFVFVFTTFWSVCFLVLLIILPNWLLLIQFLSSCILPELIYAHNSAFKSTTIYKMVI